MSRRGAGNIPHHLAPALPGLRPSDAHTQTSHKAFGGLKVGLMVPMYRLLPALAAALLKPPDLFTWRMSGRAELTPPNHDDGDDKNKKVTE